MSTASLAALASAHRFRVRLAGGEEVGADDPAFRVVLRTRALERSLLRLPSPLGLARAFVRGELDIEGDLFAAMRCLHALEASAPAGLLRALGAFRAALRPWRSAARDIAWHYDLPAEFFALFLDRRMTYTCAYWCGADETLDGAQQAKLDLVCRKLRLARGERLLDAGCGWAPLAIWAAAEYGAKVHAVTLSAAQARWADAAVRAAGLADRVTVECRDDRTLPRDVRYDKIASIGMMEHLGRRELPAFLARVRERTAPGGLALLHGITRRESAWTSGMEFLDREIFPGLDLVPLPWTLAAVEAAGLEILDVEDLRPHYARTTAEWASRLWSRREEATRIAGDAAWRRYAAYLAAASVAFAEGWIGLAQTVVRPAAARDDGAQPRLRREIYEAAGA